MYKQILTEENFKIVDLGNKTIETTYIKDGKDWVKVFTYAEWVAVAQNSIDNYLNFEEILVEEIVKG
jgi:ASC-1-like (ASCH) protein